MALQEVAKMMVQEKGKEKMEREMAQMKAMGILEVVLHQGEKMETEPEHLSAAISAV